MKKLKEEKGYTLIIALLMIVLFLSMSAVFIQASLSHAKQEQTVDQGNLSVTAAEMGVEYYTGVFKNNIDDAYNEVTNSANSNLLLEFINCKNAAVGTIETCKTEKRTKATNQFVTKLNTLMNAEIAASAINIDRENSVSQFDLQTSSVASVTSEKKVKLDLSVLGKSGTSKKVLEADITFEIPEFFTVIVANTPSIVDNIFDVPNDLPVCTETYSSTTVFPCKLSPGKDIQRLVDSIPDHLKASAKIQVTDPRVLCNSPYNYNGICHPKDLKGVTIYSSSNSIMKLDYGSRPSNFNWYHKGEVFIDKPMNQSNMTLVFESLNSLSPLNDFHGTIVLMNSDSIKETLAVGKKIKPGDSGKMCLNLSGLTLEELELVKTNFDYNSGGSKGLVYYLIDENKSSSFELHSASSVIELTKAANFLSDCGVQPIKQGDSISFGNFVNPIIDLDVEY